MRLLSTFCWLSTVLLVFSHLVVVLAIPPEKIASTWWTNWHAPGFPVSDISWSKYNRIIYSFAETAPDANTLTLTNDTSGALLRELVSTAHLHGAQVAVAVGGWTGSRYFSTAVATPANRTTFIKTLTNLVTEYDIDGLDFDWESPGAQGIGCNTISPNDTSNFLIFLRELRQSPIGSLLTLSAPVGISPYVDASGDPSTDMRGFAEVLDFIEVMNYDIWGSWSDAVGPNAPLNDTCAPPADQQGSAVSAVQAWTAAGMPLNQIVLGVASYGHSFRVSQSDAIANDTMAAYPPFNADDPPSGDAWDDQPGTDECGNYQGPGGLWDFWGLIDAGFLTPEGNGADGIAYRYDNCTQTPYVYNSTTEVMVAFDNVESFAAKGKFIESTGLRGFAMWEAGGDYNDLLLDSIRSAGGY